MVGKSIRSVFAIFHPPMHRRCQRRSFDHAYKAKKRRRRSAAAKQGSAPLEDMNSLGRGGSEKRQIVEDRTSSWRDLEKEEGEPFVCASTLVERRRWWKTRLGPQRIGLLDTKNRAHLSPSMTVERYRVHHGRRSPSQWGDTIGWVCSVYRLFSAKQPMWTSGEQQTSTISRVRRGQSVCSLVSLLWFSLLRPKTAHPPVVVPCVSTKKRVLETKPVAYFAERRESEGYARTAENLCESRSQIERECVGVRLGFLVSSTRKQLRRFENRPLSFLVREVE
mmetsp:Transcript_11782/g.31741  ORF Transcript_11782/g.31741 Transcript_11782/m.31741 type:complete len:279 (-) Transcript_11782:1850-2686(-)